MLPFLAGDLVTFLAGFLGGADFAAPFARVLAFTMGPFGLGRLERGLLSIDATHAQLAVWRGCKLGLVGGFGDGG